MSGDVHVRFCERLGRYPGATRLVCAFRSRRMRSVLCGAAEAAGGIRPPGGSEKPTLCASAARARTASASLSSASSCTGIVPSRGGCN